MERLRLWHRRLSRTLMSDCVPEGGRGCVDELTHTQLYLGSQGVEAPRNNRQERGRLAWIEGLTRVVHHGDKQGNFERNHKAQEADLQDTSHALYPANLPPGTSGENIAPRGLDSSLGGCLTRRIIPPRRKRTVAPPAVLVPPVAAHAPTAMWTDLIAKTFGARNRHMVHRPLAPSGENDSRILPNGDPMSTRVLWSQRKCMISHPSELFPVPLATGCILWDPIPTEKRAERAFLAELGVSVVTSTWLCPICGRLLTRGARGARGRVASEANCDAKVTLETHGGP